MKIFALIITFYVSSDVVCARYVPYERKRELFVQTMKCAYCLSGTRGNLAKSEYKICTGMRLKKTKKHEKDCGKKLLPDSKSGELWKIVCEDVHKANQLYDCVLKAEEKDYESMSYKEKSATLTFKKCVAKVQTVFCTKIPPVKGITLIKLTELRDKTADDDEEDR